MVLMDESPPSSEPVDCAGTAASIERSLADLRGGDNDALRRLFDALYTELHGRAAAAMARQPAAHTLQATALVGEAYVRIAKAGCDDFQDRAHFLLSASRAMRHVLVDHYRAKRSDKRATGLDIELIASPFEDRAVDMEELDAALSELADLDESRARIVELRFFGGASMDEIARVLDLPKRTLERRWQSGRAWLFKRLS